MPRASRVSDTGSRWWAILSGPEDVREAILVEMVARVIQHTGVHGFHSAVIVVERLDSPLEVITRDWYSYEQRECGKPRAAMLDWIAEMLTELSQGTELATGTECEVEGLLSQM